MILALGARGPKFKSRCPPPLYIPAPAAQMEEPINENLIDELLDSPVKKVQEDHIPKEHKGAFPFQTPHDG